MRRLSIVSFLLTISALLVMSPARAASWTATATTLDLTAGPGRTSAFLAPDGSRFAYFKGDDLCMYSLTGEKGDCVTLEDDVQIDVDSVRWSPDGKKLAFSEEFLLTFRDSDIWLYDADANTLTDVTSAPNRELNLFSNDDPTVVFTVDLTPQWSSDSQSIYFIRYTFNKAADALAKFFRLNLTDSTIEEVAPVETKSKVSTYAFDVSPDDATIVYNLDTRGAEKDGSWLLDVAAQKAKFAVANVQETTPWAYQFSADGSLVLSIGQSTGNYDPTYQHPETSPIYTFPVFGGRQQQLNVDKYVFSAGWGPEGSQLAYVTAEFDEKNPLTGGLYITDAPGKPGERVLEGRYIVPTGRSLTPIIWASNNTLLLSQAPDFKLTVVQLSQS